MHNKHSNCDVLVINHISKKNTVLSFGAELDHKVMSETLIFPHKKKKMIKILVYPHRQTNTSVQTDKSTLDGGTDLPTDRLLFVHKKDIDTEHNYKKKKHSTATTSEHYISTFQALRQIVGQKNM